MAWSIAALAAGRSKGPEPVPPSIVLITLDTVRADHIGCYGDRAAETPALDRLAREATRFANAYTVVPITLPSHAVMLTGTYPMRNGVRDFTSPGLPADIPTVAGALKKHGFSTAAFVSAYVLNSMWGLNRGFEVYDDQMNPGVGLAGDLSLVIRSGDLTTTRTIDWLDRHGQAPFFIWLHLYDAHSPYHSPQPYAGRHPDSAYDGAIAFDDAQVGRVLAELRRLDLYDSSLIILTSDHGESLGEHGEAEHGFFVYNSTLHVPLIVKWPGGQDGRGTVAQPASTIQIAATIAQSAGIPDSETRNFQGRPLARSVLKLPTTTPMPVYAESYYARDSFGWHELRVIVGEAFKYIDAPEPELYDLEHDPGERWNVIGRHELLAGSLRAKLHEFERQYTGAKASVGPSMPDSDTLEKLRSLGYVAYQVRRQSQTGDGNLADPKQKIATFDDILRVGDFRRAGDHADAARLLADLRSREPSLYVLPFEAGENDLAWGKPQEAADEFRAALQLNPKFDQALLGLGRACFELGKNAEAATAFELALRISPPNALARVALARAYADEGNPDKAEAELARVVKDHPDFGPGHAQYGEMLARKKAYEEAKRELEKGIALGYKDAESLNYLGISRGELGQHQAAVEAYKEAIQLDPRLAAAYLNMAIEYRRVGEVTEAKRYYKEACALSDELCRRYASQFAPQ